MAGRVYSREFRGTPDKRMVPRACLRVPIQINDVVRRGTVGLYHLGDGSPIIAGAIVPSREPNDAVPGRLPVSRACCPGVDIDYNNVSVT